MKLAGLGEIPWDIRLWRGGLRPRDSSRYLHPVGEMAAMWLPNDPGAVETLSNAVGHTWTCFVQLASASSGGEAPDRLIGGLLDEIMLG